MPPHRWNVAANPDPDPDAPVCAKCAANGRIETVRETGKAVKAVNVSAVYWDQNQRKHEHYGTPPGSTNYACECGNAWTVNTNSTLFPCWCGWGAAT